MTSYAEWACASNFSFLRGASHPQEMALAAKKAGLAALGLADRNSFAGIVRAFKAAKEVGLAFAPGLHLVLRDGFELLLYPRNREAYGRLGALLTLGNRRARKGGCDLGLEDALAALNGQAIALLPPENSLVPPPDWMEKAHAIVAAGDPKAVFLALAKRFDGADAARLRAANAASAALKAPLMAVSDAYFHAPERRILADALYCIREKTTIDRAGYGLSAHAERFLRTPAEMARLFADAPDAIAQTLNFHNLLQFSLDSLRYDYPDPETIAGNSVQDELAARVAAGLPLRYPHGVPPRVRDQITHELAIIETLDYAKYFLTVDDIVRFARARGILAQGRGSAANSAVCFVLGVTAVDPAHSDLLFERFISPERREPPDIDVDFEHERREEVIQHIYARYGRDHAGIAATVITYRSRSAVREIGKALGLSEDLVSALAKTVWGWSSKGVSEAHVRAELGLEAAAPRLGLALNLTRELIGFPRHLSQHTGGFVITKSRLDHVAPIHNGAMADRTFIEWDKDDLDALGLLKIDILALGMLTCIAKALKMIENHYRRPLELATIPAEDPQVYEMIGRADTIGVFQIESRAQMSMLPRLRPRCFYDLVIEVAIVRPGPIQGDMVHPYLRRRQGIEPVTFPSKALEDVLGKTLGVPLFQEQAMRIAIVAAGFSPAEADRLRRAMATFRKTGIIHQFGLRLIDGMVGNGYTRDFAERCFRQIEGFGEYGFPESHAASFALLVYASAWIKHHYPDVFLAALLNSQPMGFYAPAQLVRCARAHGVNVRPPDVNSSAWDAQLEGEIDPKREIKKSKLYDVRLGFASIKGFSAAEAAKLIAARDRGGPFQDIEDLARRSSLLQASLDKLASADAFGSLDLKRRPALWRAKAAAPIGPLFANMDADEPPKQIAADDGIRLLPAMELGEEVAWDYRTLRLSLKAHPMALLRAQCAARKALPAKDLGQARDGARLCVAGLVLVRQRPGSANGVIFATLEDETGIANIIIWPPIFEHFRPTVLGAKIMAVRGRVQRQPDGGRHDVIHVIAEQIDDWSALIHELEAVSADFDNIIAPADEVKRDSCDRRATIKNPSEASLLPSSRDFH